MSQADTRQRLLIVDDTPENIELMRQVLHDDYQLIAALNGEKALALAHAQPAPDLILLDIVMPGMDGYEVCRQLKADPATQNIPIIFVTSLDQSGNEAHGLELGAIDYISKPVVPELIRARVANHIELHRHQERLEELVLERTLELDLTRQVTIEALASLAEYRDPDTGGHIKRTQHYVRLLARLMADHPTYRDQLDNDTIELFFRTAPLHDIGKVAVADRILLKAGRLSETEFEQMKLHVHFGANALKSAAVTLGHSSFLMTARELILSHHEKWDGTGYPRGVAGTEIPLSGRLMALADVYDALISKRVYKPAIPHQRAVEIIRDGSGSHFEPLMVEIFSAHHEEFRTIAEAYRDNERDLASLEPINLN